MVRSFRAPGYPVVPGIALLLSVVCLLAMLWFNPVVGYLYFLATKAQRDRAPQNTMLAAE